MSTASLWLRFPGGVAFEVTAEACPVIAGRGACDLCLLDYFAGEIGIISLRHFKIYYRAERGFFITDLYSRNGTWLNGVRLTPDQSEYLRNGDIIRLAGAAELVIRVEVGLAATALKVAEKPLLTPREVELLRLLEQGLTQEQIAAQANIALDTVKGHFRNIREKLGVRRTYQAVHAARQNGYL